MRKLTSEELPSDNAHRGKYDWSYIFSGFWVELIQGIDFPGSVRAFSSNAYSKATAMGYKITIRNPEPNRLLIKARRMEADNA